MVLAPQIPLSSLAAMRATTSPPSLHFQEGHEQLAVCGAISVFTSCLGNTRVNPSRTSYHQVFSLLTSGTLALSFERCHLGAVFRRKQSSMGTNFKSASRSDAVFRVKEEISNDLKNSGISFASKAPTCPKNSQVISPRRSRFQRDRVCCVWCGG